VDIERGRYRRSRQGRPIADHNPCTAWYRSGSAVGAVGLIGDRVEVLRSVVAYAYTLVTA